MGCGRRRGYVFGPPGNGLKESDVAVGDVAIGNGADGVTTVIWLHLLGHRGYRPPHPIEDEALNKDGVAIYTPRGYGDR